jgi:hypothetical protein
VADQQNLSHRLGLTPGKTALIGALAVTLVVVLYLQYGPAGSQGDAANAADMPVAVAPSGSLLPEVPAIPKAESPSAASKAELPPTTPAAAETVPTDSTDHAAWQAADLATIVKYDPFALPPTFPRPTPAAGPLAEGTVVDEAERASQLADTVAQLHSELEELRQRGVHVIIRERDAYVALIGDRKIRVGEKINGFTVTAIEPDGVRVERQVQE